MKQRKILKNVICCLLAMGMLCAFGGKAMAKDVLTPKQKNIVMISAYTAKSDLENLEKPCTPDLMKA